MSIELTSGEKIATATGITVGLGVGAVLGAWLGFSWWTFGAIAALSGRFFYRAWKEIE